jgi:hypothetical protein
MNYGEEGEGEIGTEDKAEDKNKIIIKQDKGFSQEEQRAFELSFVNLR